MADRRPGNVVAIRVNPQDSMAVADIVKTLGIFQVGMSLSSAVSLSLSALINGAKQAGSIPMRDGFAYNTIMQDFTMKQSKGKHSIGITALAARDRQAQGLDESRPALDAFARAQTNGDTRKVPMPSKENNRQYEQYLDLKLMANTRPDEMDEKQQNAYARFKQANWDLYIKEAPMPTDEEYKAFTVRLRAGEELTAP